MSDNIKTLDRDLADLDIAAKEIGGVQYPRNILVDPSGADITPLTDAQLRAAAVPVSVSGSVAVTGTFWQTTQPVSIASWGGLTDAQLRAAAVPVSLASVPTHAVTQSGAWSVGITGSVAVTGTFWQATQPVSAASLPLPSGAATEATLSAASAKLPASLGPKAGSASLSVAPATDARFVVANGSGVALAMGAGYVDDNVLRVILSHDSKVTPASSAYESVADITRPANTTAYTAGDVVGGVIGLYGVGLINGHTIINTVSLRYDVATIPTGMTAFRLHMYSGSPPSALADNAAWDLPSGDRAVYLGFVDLGGMIDLGSTLYSQVDNIGKQIRIGFGYSNIWCYLQTIGGYTPASNSETLRLVMNTVGV